MRVAPLLLVLASTLALTSAAYPQYGPQDCSAYSSGCTVLSYGGDTIGISLSQSLLDQGRYGPNGEFCWLKGTRFSPTLFDNQDLYGFLYSFILVVGFAGILHFFALLFYPNHTNLPFYSNNPISLAALFVCVGSILAVTLRETNRVFTLQGKNFPIFGKLTPETVANWNFWIISGYWLINLGFWIFLVTLWSAARYQANTRGAAPVPRKGPSAGRLHESSQEYHVREPFQRAQERAIFALVTTVFLALFARYVFDSYASRRSPCNREVVTNPLDAAYISVNVALGFLYNVLLAVMHCKYWNHLSGITTYVSIEMFGIASTGFFHYFAMLLYAIFLAIGLYFPIIQTVELAAWSNKEYHLNGFPTFGKYDYMFGIYWAEFFLGTVFLWSGIFFIWWIFKEREHTEKNWIASSVERLGKWLTYSRTNSPADSSNPDLTNTNTACDAWIQIANNHVPQLHGLYNLPFDQRVTTRRDLAVERGQLFLQLAELDKQIAAHAGVIRARGGGSAAAAFASTSEW